ncbi:MAG: hypothetical protein HP493_05050, partial [Nitrospira sp.]|nr:hypothetical protein [Nitrospira sp.]
MMTSIVNGRGIPACVPPHRRVILLILKMTLVVVWLASAAAPCYAGAPTDTMKTTIDEVLRIV